MKTMFIVHIETPTPVFEIFEDWQSAHEYLIGCDFARLWDRTYKNDQRFNASIIERDTLPAPQVTIDARNYINQLKIDAELSTKEFYRQQHEFFQKNRSHISDCFVCTSYVAYGKEYHQEQLESEIVRLVELRNQEFNPN